MKKLFDITTIKFIFVGIVNTIVGTGVMFLFYNVLGAGYWVASASNYIVGSIVSYFLNKYFTFKNNEKSLKVIVRFVINISLCYIAAYGLAKPVAYRILEGYSKSIQENIAMLIGMCLFVGLNYIGQRFVVFKVTGDDIKNVEQK